MKKVYALVPLALSLVPKLAFAAALTFQSLALQITELLDLGTMTLIVLGIVLYFWGIASNVTHFGDDEKGEKKKAFFVWGIIVLFVMVTVWGIIQLLQNTIFSSSPYDPTTGAPATVFCDRFGSCGSIE